MDTLLIVKLGSTFPWLSKRMGDFEDWIMEGLQPFQGRVQVSSASDSQSLPSVRDAAGIILTGSHSMVSAREGWSERAAAWLLDVLAQEKPLLGICYGHQLLAHAAGGLVGYNSRGYEFGTTQVFLNEDGHEDPLFSQLPSPMPVQVCHAQSVLRLPADAVALASNAHDSNHAFRMGRNAWGVQFHPEFSADAVRAYIDHYSQELRAEGQDPEALLDAVDHTPLAGSILSRFRDLACHSH